MADTWDDSDGDDWDVSDDELDARLNNLDVNKKEEVEVPVFEEEDLAVKEKAEADAREKAILKSKGSALAKKKAEAEARKEEEEIARQALKIETELEANLTPDERRKLERERIEKADNDITNDLFGGVDAVGSGPAGKVAYAGDKLVMKDLTDHLKHARKVGACVKGHGKAHLAATFLKEALQQCKDVLGDEDITDIIKTCNVIKNDKLLAAKKKQKGQAQKKKKDKAAEAKAKKIQNELYGESENYDDYDAYGEQFEDDFF